MFYPLWLYPSILIDSSRILMYLTSDRSTYSCSLDFSSSFSSLFGLPIFLLYWMPKLNVQARLLRITTFFMGELGIVEIRRRLDLELLRQLIDGVIGRG